MAINLFINDTKDLHHAYLIEGDSDILFADLSDFFKKELSITIRGNPDFIYNKFETFGIDDGRFMQNDHIKKSFGGGRKIFVISTDSITHEAQNSLLKIFEEPLPSVHFFLLMKSAETILPTLKSRMIHIKHGKATEYDSDLVENFLKSTPAKRLKIVSPIIEKKDKNAAISFLDSLEYKLHSLWSIEKRSEEKVFALNELMKCRSYLRDRSPSVKMILEHICLIVNH